MKKRIFISGAVREYDSEHPEILAEEIRQYICDHLVAPENQDIVKVTVDEPEDKVVRICFLFTTGDKIGDNTISQPLYRCFTGEYSGFTAENTLWLTMGFGPSFPMNVRLDVEDIATAFRKNTWFYKANRFKDFAIVELEWGLMVHIKY